MGALAWLQNLDFAGSGVGASTFQSCWAEDEYTLLFGMKKNVASQVVGVQMITASDGSAFTGAAAVAVTGDGGTQGSGGGTGPTHEGGGCYTYVPTQAETNFNHVCFTFSGTGAISKTVQIYTTFPQTGDAFVTATNVETDTQDIQSRLPAALVSGRIDASVGAIAANAITASSIASDAITAAKIADGAIDAATFAAGAITATVIATDAIDADAIASDAITEIQSGLSTLNAAGVRAAVGLASANLDTQLDALPTNAELATALGTADDATLAAIAALNNPSAGAIADAVWDEAKSGHTTAGTYGQHFGSATESATVNDASATTTSFVTTLASAVNDHYIGRVIIFTSGTLQNQATDITDYVGATKTVTVTALTSAPANGVTFILV